MKWGQRGGDGRPATVLGLLIACPANPRFPMGLHGLGATMLGDFVPMQAISPHGNRERLIMRDIVAVVGLGRRR